MLLTSSSGHGSSRPSSTVHFQVSDYLGSDYCSSPSPSRSPDREALLSDTDTQSAAGYTGGVGSRDHGGVKYRLYPWRWLMLAAIFLLNVSNGTVSCKCVRTSVYIFLIMVDLEYNFQMGKTGFTLKIVILTLRLVTHCYKSSSIMHLLLLILLYRCG